MPSYAAPSLPPEAEWVVSVLGANPARVAIIAFVSDHPGAIVSEIAKGTDLAIGTTKTHVARLAGLGVLVPNPGSDVPYAERRGLLTRYTVDEQRLADHYRELGRVLRLSD